MSRSRTPRNHNATHAMSSSCALVPRAGAAHATRTVGGRAPRAAAAPAAAVGRAAARPRHPLAARTVAASRARASAAGSARDARARARAQDASRAGTSGVSALSVEDRQNDGGDGAGEPIEAIVVDAVEASDPMADESDAEDARRGTVGEPGGHDDDGVPFLDEGPCTTTEEGDEVCELPFPFAPGETGETEKTPGEKTPAASVAGAEIENDHPTARAAALMRGVLPSDDAVIASTLGLDPTRGGLETSPTSDVSRNSRNLWWRALKLPMYSVAAAPLTTAAAMCHHWFGCVNAPQLGCLLGGACLVIAWLNLANDAWDFSTGVDANASGGKPESVVRLLGGDASAARAAHAAATACLLAGVCLIAKGVRYGLVVNGAATTNTLCAAGAMLAAAVALGHAYQGPPFRLSYVGLGEPICFAAFGPLATGAFYLLLAAGVPRGSVWGGAASGTLSVASVLHPGVLGAAALTGLTTTAILFASHLHQEEGDRAAGKMSPIVRLGVPRAVDALRKGLIAHHVLALCLASLGLLPVMACVAVALCAPLAYAIAAFAEATKTTPRDLFKTKYLCVRWHVAHALMLGLGCWLDPWMPWHLAAGRIAGSAVGAAF